MVNQSNNLPIIIGSAFGGFILLLAFVAFFIRRRYSKNESKSS
jgi:hypothetical protein